MTNQNPAITPKHEKYFREIVELREALENFQNHHLYFSLDLSAMNYTINRLLNEKLGKDLLNKFKSE